MTGISGFLVGRQKRCIKRKAKEKKKKHLKKKNQESGKDD